MSTIKTGTTLTTAYQVVGDTTGALVIQTGATPTTAVTLGADQSVTFAQAANLPNTFGFKNRIINGAMQIDQRNAGASVNTNLAFPVDRFILGNSSDGVATAQQSSTAPAGFPNSVVITTTTADASLAATQYLGFAQQVEGLNVSDLAWGTASAATVTLSFWTRSSLTGTFSGSLRNSAGDRSYVFTYTISAANTWEKKSVTITGDTSGTWLTTNAIGIRLWFSLGTGSTYTTGTSGSWVAGNYLSVTSSTSVIGTLSANLYITGVQLEKGSTATSFDYRPYGTELALCQRYFEMSYPVGTAPGTITGNGIRSASAAAAFVGGTSTRAFMFNATFATQKRVVPNTITFYDPAASNASGKISGYSSNTQYTVSSSSGAGATNLGSYITTTTGTQTEIYQFHFTADSEL